VRIKNKKKQLSPTHTFKIDAKEKDYLFVASSQIPNAGKGLFTAISIYKDEVVSIFKGEILSKQEAKTRSENGKDSYFINMLDGSIMDSNMVKCFAKYANDAEGKIKSKFKCNSIISINEDLQVCIVASRDIKAGEEIFCSYGKGYWRSK